MTNAKKRYNITYSQAQSAVESLCIKSSDIEIINTIEIYFGADRILRYNDSKYSIILPHEESDTGISYDSMPCHFNKRNINVRLTIPKVPIIVWDELIKHRIINHIEVASYIKGNYTKPVIGKIGFWTFEYVGTVGEELIIDCYMPFKYSYSQFPSIT